MILTVTLNPVIDTTFFVDEVRPAVYRTEAQRVTHLMGGKGTNVARALRILGEPATALIALGGRLGRFGAELLAEEGLPTALAWVSGETRLMITISDRDNRQQAFFAPNEPFTAEDAAAVRRVFTEAVAGAAAVALCGSSPGPLADGLFPELLRAAAGGTSSLEGRGLLTLLDSSGAGLRHGLTAAPTIVKVNRAEAEGLLGRPLPTLPAQSRPWRPVQGDSLWQVAALTELRQTGAGWAILTLGEQGALLAADGDCWAAWPPAVAVVNPIGSGDAMTAGLLAGVRRGLPPAECLRLGTAAATANTLTWDACRFAAEDVTRLLAEVEVVTLSP